MRLFYCLKFIYVIRCKKLIGLIMKYIEYIDDYFIYETYYTVSSVLSITRNTKVKPNYQDERQKNREDRYNDIIHKKLDAVLCIGDRAKYIKVAVSLMENDPMITADEFHAIFLNKLKESYLMDKI